MGVEPILINSALVSAQQRNRLYWCNWEVEQPKDKGILLKDILETGYGVGVEQKGSIITKQKDKANCLMARDYKGFGNQEMTGVAEPINLNTYFRDYGTKGKIFSDEAKIQCLTASMGTGGGNIPLIAKPIRVGQIGKGGQGQRIYSVRGKSVSMSALGGGQGAKTGLYKIDLPDGDYIIRKLSPIEAERCQTLPDNWTEGISSSRRYQCIGNGWTVDIIAHIFSTMDKPKFKEELF